MTRTTYELIACPVCGSREAPELADREAMKREVERVWLFHQRRLRDDVPPERLIDRVAFSQDPPIRLARCSECDHIFRNPRERLETLVAAYDADAPDPQVLEALLTTQTVAYRAQATRLTEAFGRAGDGLEVGSYVGGFLAAAREAGWGFSGIDVSGPAVAFARSKGFDVTQGEITSLARDGRGARYDAVAIWNTFEQLYDSRAAVAAARRLLRDQGMLVVRVPNGAFYAEWRARLEDVTSGLAERLLVHNNLLGFPYRQGFTERSMTRLLRDGGFEIEHVYGDTLVPIADEWTTRLGALEERVVKGIEGSVQHGWDAPWVEVYARARSASAN